MPKSLSSFAWKSLDAGAFNLFSLCWWGLFLLKRRERRGREWRSTGSPNTAFKQKMHRATRFQKQGLTFIDQCVQHYAVASSPMTKWLPSTPKHESHFEITALPLHLGFLSSVGSIPGWLLFMSHLLMDRYSHIHIQPVPSYKSCMEHRNCVRFAWWACRDIILKFSRVCMTNC